MENFHDSCCNINRFGVLGAVHRQPATQFALYQLDRWLLLLWCHMWHDIWQRWHSKLHPPCHWIGNSCCSLARSVAVVHLHMAANQRMQHAIPSFCKGAQTSMGHGFISNNFLSFTCGHELFCHHWLRYRVQGVWHYYFCIWCGVYLGLLCCSAFLVGEDLPTRVSLGNWPEKNPRQTTITVLVIQFPSNFSAAAKVLPSFPSQESRGEC